MIEKVIYGKLSNNWDAPDKNWPMNKPTRSEVTEIIVKVDVEPAFRNRGTFTYLKFTIIVQEVLRSDNHVKVTYDSLTAGNLAPLRVLRYLLMQSPFSLNPYSHPKDKFKVGRKSS